MNTVTRQQYDKESRKGYLLAFIIAIIFGSIYALISKQTDILDPFFMVPVLFVFIAALAIIRSKLNTKYKVPNVYSGNNFYSSKNNHQWLSPSSSSDPFRDDNPSYPGTAAWAANERRHRY